MLKERGIVRPDAHKKGRPMVPHGGGMALMASMTVTSAISAWLYPFYSLQIALFWLTSAFAFAVGLVDDLVVLRGETKTALTVIAILPIALGAIFYPGTITLGRPRAPFVGRMRLTIVYWLLLPLAIAGPANAVNMLDVMNGIMPGTMMVASLSIIASSYVLAEELGLILGFMLLGALVGYYPYNKYPAKIFNGDSGSLMVGAGIGAIAVLTRQEIVSLVALAPQVLNAFFVVSSIGGLKEHRELGARPIKVLSDEKLVANLDTSAPLSLTRLMLLLGGSSNEREIAKAYLLLQGVASAFSIITALLMVMG